MSLKAYALLIEHYNYELPYFFSENKHELTHEFRQ